MFQKIYLFNFYSSTNDEEYGENRKPTFQSHVPVANLLDL